MNGARSADRARNDVFTPIAVPAGACDVDLVYEPTSFRLALGLLAGALAAISIWLYMSARAKFGEPM